MRSVDVLAPTEREGIFIWTREYERGVRLWLLHEQPSAAPPLALPMPVLVSISPDVYQQQPSPLAPCSLPGAPAAGVEAAAGRPAPPLLARPRLPSSEGALPPRLPPLPACRRRSCAVLERYVAAALPEVQTPARALAHRVPDRCPFRLAHPGVARVLHCLWVMRGPACAPAAAALILAAARCGAEPPHAALAEAQRLAAAARRSSELESWLAAVRQMRRRPAAWAALEAAGSSLAATAALAAEQAWLQRAAASRATRARWRSRCTGSTACRAPTASEQR